MKLTSILLSATLLASTQVSLAEDRPVGITSDLMSFTMTHEGEAFEIKRNQDSANEIHPNYALTSRPCPPFCLQPMILAPGVETLGELEFIAYMQRLQAGDNSIIIIDSRTEDWVKRGTIPGAINIPWTALSQSSGADIFDIALIMSDEFAVQDNSGLWDFSAAKTLVLFCNGAWCGQSPANIRTLLQYGYPADKLKWYRGGMQAWETFGLTTTTSDEFF